MRSHTLVRSGLGVAEELIPSSDMPLRMNGITVVWRSALPASPMLVFTAATLLGDIYRLVSREPGARALARLDRRQQLSHRELVALLRDARLVLDGFAWNHRDHDAHYGDGWLTYESIEEFRQSR